MARRRVRYHRTPWWQTTPTLVENEDRPDIFNNPPSPDANTQFDFDLTTTTGVPVSTTGTPPATVTTTTRPGVVSPDTSFTTTTDVPLPTTTTEPESGGPANPEGLLPGVQFDFGEVANREAHISLIRDLYINDPTFSREQAEEALRDIRFEQGTVNWFIRSWNLTILRGQEEDDRKLQEELEEARPPTDPEVFEDRVTTMLGYVFEASARQHNLPGEWGTRFVQDNWPSIREVILSEYLRNDTGTRYVPAGLSPASGTFVEQEYEFIAPDQPELNSLDLIDRAVSQALWMLTGTAGNPYTIPQGPVNPSNLPERREPIRNTWDLAVTWPLTLSPEEDAAAAGARSARTVALSQLDEAQLTEQANNLYQRYLLRGAPDAQAIAQAYTETVGNNPDQRLDYEQFVLNRIRQDPAYDHIYANKPSGTQELDYLDFFYRTWIGQFGATDDTLNTVKDFAHSNTSSQGMQEAARHNPQTTRSQGFMEQIGDQYRELGDLLAP